MMSQILTHETTERNSNSNERSAWTGGELALVS